MGVVVEEMDETVFWLELLVEAGYVTEQRMISLMQEARELLLIFSRARATAKRNS
jgi:hypothetical protein